MLAADAAERDGDAQRALEVVTRRPLDPAGALFWRPSRVQMLRQLVLLGPRTPRWAISRWLLAQAGQHLDATDHRRHSARKQRALDAAVGLRGGPAVLSGRDDTDRLGRVADHDWVFRQLDLYELGGLSTFVRSAAPGLLARAEPIDGWVRAQMGGFCFLGPQHARLLWLDHASGTTFATPNIGTGDRLMTGDDVIARRVPVAGGTMFDDVPLRVPRPVALAVASDPAGWLDVLRGVSDQVRDDTIRTHDPRWRGLLSDVGLEDLELVLAYRPAEQRIEPCSSPDDRARAALDLAQDELDRESDEAERFGHGGLDFDEDFDDGWDGWAQVHAAVLDPIVCERLPHVVRADDLELLHQIAARVAEPARSVVAGLVDRLRSAA